MEISIAYLSRIERERENPPRDHLISVLAGALCLPLDDLEGSGDLERRRAGAPTIFSAAQFPASISNG